MFLETWVKEKVEAKGFKALPCIWTNPIDPFVHLVNGCEIPNSSQTLIGCNAKKIMVFGITIYNLET